MENFAEPTNLDWRFKGACSRNPEVFDAFPDLSLGAKEPLLRTQIEDIESEIGVPLSLIDEEGTIDREAVVEIHKQIKDLNARRERAAKAICGTCIVKEKCLAWAINIGEPGGIWGGLNERERNKLVRNKNGRRLRIAS